MNTYRGRRRLLGLAIAVMAVSPYGVPARAGVAGVNEVGRAFQPAEIRIGLNDRVVWTNRSNQSHTVTFSDRDLHPSCDPDAPALLRVGCQGGGATAERTFTSPGTYPYYCKLHQGEDPPMRGVVVVNAATTTLAPTTSTLPGKTSSTTATTLRATSSTTTSTRPLATSSTMITSSTTTTTSETTSVLLPGEPPPFSDDTSAAGNRAGDSKSGSGSGTVALIVGLLLAVSAGGGYLLWRLRPGRA